MSIKYINKLIKILLLLKIFILEMMHVRKNIFISISLENVVPLDCTWISLPGDSSPKDSLVGVPFVERRIEDTTVGQGPIQRSLGTA
jgi:hypothetical protein